MIEAGCTIIGGHSIRDDEPNSAIRYWPNKSRKGVEKRWRAPGDRLLFTKSLGLESSPRNQERRRKASMD